MKVPATISIGGAFRDWTLEALRDAVVAADKAGIEAVILPDAIAPADSGEGWPDALILIGWLVTVTERIRLVASVSSLGHQPYNLARRLASLGLIGGGRVGWLVDDGGQADAFAAFSGEQRLAGADLASRQREFETVVAGLWESWDADALVMDKVTAQFFRPSAMHVLGHKGEHFSVLGPLNVMRSPPDGPTLLHAGDVAGALNVDSPAAFAALLQEAGQ